jgi:uncharacterized membrane protein
LGVDSNRTLGFVGALLITLGVAAQFLTIEQFYFPIAAFSGIGATFGVLGFIGIILFLIAMHGFAKDYDDASIFNSALYGFLSSIVGGAVMGVLAIVLVLSNYASFFNGFNPSLFSSTSLQDLLQRFIGVLVYVFIAASIVGLIQALFYKRVFDRLAGKSGVRLFHTVGLLMVVGASLTVITSLIAALLVVAVSEPATTVLLLPAIGGAVGFAAWVVATKAFLSIKPPVSPTHLPPTTQTYPSATGQVKYCPYCGAPNRVDAAYCTHCGKQQ